MLTYWLLSFIHIVIHHIIPQKQRLIKKYPNERANVGSFHLSISKKNRNFYVESCQFFGLTSQRQNSY